MANKRIMYISIGVICALLIAATVATALTMDNEPPVISVPNEEIVYKYGMSEELLLRGVTAFDERDGDVTDSVIIDSIVPIDDGACVQITYAARDKRNNITNAIRLIKCDGENALMATEESEIEQESEEVVEEAVEEQEPIQEEIIAETSEVEEPAIVEEPADAENEQKAEDEEAERRRREEAARAQAEAAQAQRAAEEESNRKAQKELEEVVAKAVAEAAEGVPHIALSEHRVVVPFTSYFDPYAYVASATDDKDNVMARLTVNSNVNTLVPGVYSVSYYCTDTEDHKSNVEVLTVIVSGPDEQ